jgi:NitT/TauT family transport system substrate-binding protein
MPSSFKPLRVRAILPLAALFAALAGDASAQSVRVAFGDIASVEAANLLIALERVKERGVDVEIIEFNAEDIANQAVVNGQADIGVGAPYAIIQNVQTPIRMFYQLSALRFFPVVDKTQYPDWASLDGGSFAVHSRGSGTEAMARLVEQEEGITFGEISYVPGSDVRTLALIRGNIGATFLDIAGRDVVLAEDPEKFGVLEIADVDATDEALFARLDWMQENAETMDILVEELLATWTEINADPSVVSTHVEEMGLLPDLPDTLRAEIEPYFTQAVETGTFPADGGSPAVFEDDAAFFSVSGQITGDPASLSVDEFWYFAPLERARAASGAAAPSNGESEAVPAAPAN